MTGCRRPLRVLHLRDSPWIDGPGRTILETAALIDRSRIDYQVGVFVPVAGKPHPLLEALRQRKLPAHEIVDDGSSLSKLLRRVEELADGLQIDILHTSEFRSNVVGLLCRRRRTFRLVSTAHGWIANDLWGKTKVFADRVLRRRFDHVILVSAAMRDRLPRWWVPDDRVSVLHNALVAERFVNLSRPIAAGGNNAEAETRMLNVGRLSAEKGQSLLLRALAELASSYPRLRVDFAGIGPLADELMREAQVLGIAHRVKFHGYVEDMRSLYQCADLVVQSSLTEGLPNVMLEAGFIGVPVVATDVGGTREVIEHGVTGWLIQPASVGALVEGIGRYLAEPRRFLEMTIAARNKVEREFSFDARTADQIRIYECVSGIGS